MIEKSKKLFVWLFGDVITSIIALVLSGLLSVSDFAIYSLIRSLMMIAVAPIRRGVGVLLAELSVISALPSSLAKLILVSGAFSTLCTLVFYFFYGMSKTPLPMAAFLILFTMIFINSIFLVCIAYLQNTDRSFAGALYLKLVRPLFFICVIGLLFTYIDERFRNGLGVCVALIISFLLIIPLVNIDKMFRPFFFPILDNVPSINEKNKIISNVFSNSVLELFVMFRQRAIILIGGIFLSPSELGSIAFALVLLGFQASGGAMLNYYFQQKIVKQLGSGCEELDSIGEKNIFLFFYSLVAFFVLYLFVESDVFLHFFGKFEESKSLITTLSLLLFVSHAIGDYNLPFSRVFGLFGNILLEFLIAFSIAVFIYSRAVESYPDVQIIYAFAIIVPNAARMMLLLTKTNGSITSIGFLLSKMNIRKT